ncbi:MAG: hypothetical protein NT010_00325 [Proteobacteria bacterium]|nr:hypothetical protein [Pseudomonadota bacterium]
MAGMFRFGWAVSFAGRNRTERTMEDRKAKQTAEDGHPRHAVARPSENLKRNASTNLASVNFFPFKDNCVMVKYLL